MNNQMMPPLGGVTRDLIIINVAAYFGSVFLLGDQSDGGLGRANLALFMPGNDYFQPFQIATHMFMHGDLGHLFFNMLSLFMFGPMVEMVWGPKRFLFYYLTCGIGAMVLHMGVQYWELSSMGIDPTLFNGSMWGASGCLFGVMAAYGYLFPNNTIQMLFPPIPIKAKYYVMIFGILELFYGIRGDSTNIAHFAHVGGAVAGLLLILFWNKSKVKF